MYSVPPSCRSQAASRSGSFGMYRPPRTKDLSYMSNSEIVLSEPHALSQNRSIFFPFEYVHHSSAKTYFYAPKASARNSFFCLPFLLLLAALPAALPPLLAAFACCHRSSLAALAMNFVADACAPDEVTLLADTDPGLAATLWTIVVAAAVPPQALFFPFGPVCTGRG
jgi:hypothetical protein